MTLNTTDGYSVADDPIYPNVPGYQQMGDVLYAAINALVALGKI